MIGIEIKCLNTTETVIDIPKTIYLDLVQFTVYIMIFFWQENFHTAGGVLEV